MPKAPTFDDDMGFDAPVRKRTPRKPGAAATRKKGRSKRRRINMVKVARIAGIGMTVVVGVGIAVNALMMQKGHHPAPLFGHQVALAAAAPPVPPAKPVRVAAPAAPPVGAPAIAPVPPAKPHRDVAEASDVSDPIATLLRTGAVPTSGDHADPKMVLGVQHALVKLGFPLKPNGTFGPSTRKAILSFEKERHLPAKGELSRRLVRILSAESGVRID